MRFNIFDDLYITNDSNLTLYNRIYDTFRVISGGGRGYRGENIRLGLFDYLTLGITGYLIGWDLDFFKMKFSFGESRLYLGLIYYPFAILRVVFSALLTLCLLPLVILIHYTIGFMLDSFLISLINKKSLLKIDELIEATVFQKKTTLTIKINDYQYLAEPGVADYLIKQLNNNPSIKGLHFGSPYDIDIERKIIKKSIKYLNHIETLEDQFYHPGKEDFILFAESRIENICINEVYISGENLIEFFKQNRNLLVLEGFNFPKNTDLLDKYKNLMQREGIQKGCIIRTKEHYQESQEIYDQINFIAEQINKATPIVEWAFKVYQIMSKSEEFNLDITKYLSLTILQFIPKELLQTNIKGFMREIRANRFFPSASIKSVPQRILVEGTEEIQLDWNVSSAI